MESQIELNEERLRLREKYNEALPELRAAQIGVFDVVYKDGALSTKVKRLMSLAIALRTGTTNCILAQTNLALEAGATREEILETLAVVYSMGGTCGVAESLRVIKLLDELDKL